MGSTLPTAAVPPLGDALELQEETAAGDPQDAKAVAKDAPETEMEPPTHHANGLADQTNYLPVRSIIIVFLALQVTVALSFLDQSIVATALPNISASFNSGRASSWVASAYLLTGTAFQPIWGRCSDIFGRKMTLIGCITGFLIGSLACAVAQSMTQLIVFRGLQGVGGGGLLTLTLIIVSDVVSLQERGKYQGIIEMSIAAANAGGPLLGGVLSQKDWRLCFWINLPIGAVALLIIIFFLPLKAVHGDFKTKLLQIDYGGAALTLVGTTLLLLPLNWGGTSFPWDSAPVIGCLCGGFITFILFFVWEGTKARIPIVPPFIFRVVMVSAVFFNTFIAGAAILVQLFYLPQFFQIVRGDSAIRSGVLILPLLLVVTLFVFICGQTISRTGIYRPHIVIGYSMWCIGLGLLSTLNETTSTAKIIGYLVLIGAGQGQTVQTTMLAAQAAVERSEMSVVTSTRNFLRSLGGTVFLAVAAAVINNTLRKDLLPLGFDSSTISAVIDDPTAIWRATKTNGSALFDLSPDQKAAIIRAYVRGFRTLFLVFVGLIGLNCIVAIVFIKQLSLVRDDEEALKKKGAAWIKAKADKKRGERDVERGEGSAHESTVVESTAVELEEARPKS